VNDSFLLMYPKIPQIDTLSMMAVQKSQKKPSNSLHPDARLFPYKPESATQIELSAHPAGNFWDIF